MGSMKKYLLIFNLLLGVTQPAFGKEIFRIGDLNNNPQNAEEGLVENEFKILSQSGRTAKVRNKKDFPQRLIPGQRIAVFLDGTPKNNLVIKAVLVADTTRNLPALSIIFNDIPLWTHSLSESPTFIYSVLPASYFEKGTNNLQIRNLGTTTIAFDCFWIEEDDSLIKKTPKKLKLIVNDLGKIPRKYRIPFQAGISEYYIYPSKKLEFEKKSKEPFCNAQQQDIKNNIKALVKDYPSEKNHIADLWSGMYSHQKMGKDFYTYIKGNPDPEQIAILTDAGREHVKCWFLKKNIPLEFGNLHMKLDNFSMPKLICLKTKPDINTCCFSFGDSPIPKNLMSFLIEKNKTGEIDFPLEAWGIWTCKDITGLGLKIQKKHVKAIPIKITHWLWSGGTGLILNDIADGGMMFGKLTGKPLVPFYALEQSCKVFDGNPVPIPANIVSLVANDFFKDTYWQAAQNAPGVVTIQIASNKDAGKDIEVLCLTPWSGETEMVITKGILPKEYPVKEIDKIEIKQEIIQIPEGLNAGIFKYKGRLQPLMNIRLIQKGKKLPKKRLDSWNGAKQLTASFKSNIAKSLLKRPEPSLIRTPIRTCNGAVGIQSNNYHASKIDATRGNIEKSKNVVPWEKKSNLIEISFSEEKTDPNEGARFFFGPGPEKNKEFSFWVFPRVSNENNKKYPSVNLKFYFDDHFLSISLKPDVWQRIVLPCKKIKPPLWGDFCIIGDPKLPEYKKGNKVSFEFNGFCVLGDEHKEKGATGLKSVRFMKNKEEIRIPAVGIEPAKKIEMDVGKLILTGLPGKYFEYRYVFSDAVSFKKVSALSQIKGLDLIWHKDAQILEVKGTFSGKDYQVSNDLYKLLSAAEKKSLKEGEITPIGIKLLYEK